MKIRSYSVFLILIILLGMCCYSIYNVSMGSEYVAATERQNLYRVNITTSRGIIYDRSLNPLTDTQRVYMAAVAPTIESSAQIDKVTEGEKRELIAAMLENGRPFKIEVPQKVDSVLVDTFYIARRYSDDQLAPHLIGYLDSEGNGAAGIERAMNDVLQSRSGSIDVYYHVDAIGRVIAGDDRKIVNTYKESIGGVALTIDRDIQKFVQEAARKLGKGAVIVSEVPGCEVRAIASAPAYSPNDIGAAIENKDSPLLNRAFSEYSPGSVFKLAAAAQEIELGEYGYYYNCTGSVVVDKMEFNCYGGIAHGRVNLHTALQKSCNCYFIKATERMGAQAVLSMAYNMGMGTELEFGRGYYSARGNLADARELLNPRALANFSFGQGSTTVTPIQVTGMINAVASNGKYTQPKIIEGIVDDGMNVHKTQSAIIDAVSTIMSEDSAKRLKSYMESAVLYGTARRVASENYTAGVKTGTAQTGKFIGERELLHFWFCGYVGEPGKPKYTITVLSEYTLDDEGKTAQVWGEIAEYLAALTES